jgi:hypothetical protein
MHIPIASSTCAGKRAGSRKCASCHEQAEDLRRDLRVMRSQRVSRVARIYWGYGGLLSPDPLKLEQRMEQWRTCPRRGPARSTTGNLVLCYSSLPSKRAD